MEGNHRHHLEVDAACRKLRGSYLNIVSCAKHEIGRTKPWVVREAHRHGGKGSPPALVESMKATCSAHKTIRMYIGDNEYKLGR